MWCKRGGIVVWCRRGGIVVWCRWGGIVVWCKRGGINDAQDSDEEEEDEMGVR